MFVLMVTSFVLSVRKLVFEGLKVKLKEPRVPGSRLAPPQRVQVWGVSMSSDTK